MKMPKRRAGKRIAPFAWYGSKQGMLPHMLALVPPHKTYLEAFGGSAALLFAKEPAEMVEAYNDVDHGLVQFFRVLRDEEQFEKFVRRITAWPYSREEFERAKATWWQEPGLDVIERAVRWYVVAAQSFSGVFSTGWQHSVTTRSAASRWANRVDALPEFHARLSGVQIEQLDARIAMARYDSAETFHYLDPPYILDTRRVDAGYVHDLEDGYHVGLVRIMLKLTGMVLLSGYAHEIYIPLEEAGWERREFDVDVMTTRNRPLNRREYQTKRVECLWLNPKLLEVLSNEETTKSPSKRTATRRRAVRRRPNSD